jgi:hypothetical protein
MAACGSAGQVKKRSLRVDYLDALRAVPGTTAAS